MTKTFEFICGVACWFLIFLVLGALLGCARQTPVESAFGDANQAVVEMKQTLPEECKTEAVLEKISLIESKYEKAQNVCEIKIKDTQIKYERALGALILIIFVFFAKNFIKR